MESTVRPFPARFKAERTVCSVSASRFAVISSNKRMRGWLQQPGNGKQLPLSLGEKTWFAGSVVAFRETAYNFIQSCKTCGSLGLFQCDIRVKQGDLVQDRSGNHGKILFYTADDLSSLVFRECIGRLSVNKNVSFLRCISPKSSLKIVLFPAPVRPVKVTCSPSFTEKLRDCRISGSLSS
mgnify:CR=1 FL=1